MMTMVPENRTPHLALTSAFWVGYFRAWWATSILSVARALARLTDDVEMQLFAFA